MADKERIIYGIGFDLASGVNEVIKEWNSKEAKRVQKAIDEHPIKVKLELDNVALKALSKMSSSVTSETKKSEGAINGLKQQLKALNSEWEKLSASQRSGTQGELLRQQYRSLSNEAQGYTSTLRSAVSAEDRAIAAKERGTKAIQAQTNAYKTQSNYLSRLIQRMGVYFGIHQAISFLRNIRETTMEFELQRVALGAIIGDLEKSNALFEQIKAAAVKSPFQIKELVTYTKQLAAYKIESDELFGTTQRLADISAGLGVGMERLVLAYGQIRAAGYLRGSEVRQLTEAFIPIVEELAKKMSALRGETVSAAEVMGMISERAISFGMVKEVFEDMTNAGGMFYKMQEKQAETLAGQWSNLKDALSIMYDEMGRSEGVNATLKGTISIAKSLVESWREVKIVVEAVGLATIAYVGTMKNAAIASKALSMAEFTRLGNLRGITIYMPKFLASTKLATKLTTAYRLATIKSAAATHLLSKAFWGVTKALLSNPFTLVIAGLVALTYAIFKFSTKTKTAQEHIDDLNKSVAAFKEHKEKIEPLIKQYDQLSTKVNKNVDEQNKLKSVTKELAQAYPSAITQVKKYGDEVEIAANKVKGLYSNESNAYKHLVESTLSENKEKLKELQKQYNTAQSTFERGTLLKTDVESYATIERDLTAKERRKYAKEMFILEQEMKSLIEAIDMAEVSLGKITSKAKRAIEAFGSWKKTLQGFKTGWINKAGNEDVFFDDDTIANFANLNSALEKTAEVYNNYTKDIERYEKNLLSKKISKEEKDDIERQKARAIAFKNTAKAILSYYNVLHLVEEKSTDPKTNPRIAQLNEELSTVEKIYKEYQELRKFMSDKDARARIADMFDDVNLTMLSQALSPAEMRAQLQKALDEAKKMGDKKQILELEYKLGKFDADEEQRRLEKSLKDLSDKISRTKTAKEFFDRILGLTGDKQLSATLTLSVYGTTGDDLQKQLVEQVQGAFIGQDLSKAINTDINSIDLSALREIYNNLPKDFQEQQKKSMKQVLDMLEKEQNDLANNFAKLLMDYDEMEQKRVTITQKATQEIATLEQGLQAQIEGIRQNKEITDKDSAIADATARAEAVRKAILAREKLELSKLSPAYIRFFSSINAMAMETATSTRTQLRRALFDAFEQGGISAEELRKELKAIDTQFNKLNENATLFSSYATGGFDAWLQKLQQNADELDAIAARMMKLESIDQMEEGDKNFVNKMLGVFGNKGQKSLSALATSFNGDMSQMGKSVATVGSQMQGMFSNAMGAIAIVDMIIKAVGQSIEAIQQVIDQINSMRNEENQIGGWFKYISDFNKYAVSGWEKLKSGNIAGALADTAGSIISIFQNIQSDKLKRLNAEIERQQEIIDNLSYSYERLAKAQEKAFGSDYISNYQQRVRNLQAQQRAYEKQAELERSKGKKADEKKAKEYEKQARDIAQEIADMQSELSEYFLGSDLASAAREFASSWVEAYKEYGSTTEAIKDKFKDMIQNMIIESFAARIMETALKPIYDEVDALSKDGQLSIDDARKIANLTDDAIGGMNSSLSNLMVALQSAGISIRGIGGELTGISKDIATASEESILGLAAGINTQNFYISQIPPKLDTIIAMLQNGGQGINMQDLVTIQNQHLSYLPSIAQHTAETVAECKQIVVETRRTADALERVIKPRGTQASHTMNTTIS